MRKPRPSTMEMFIRGQERQNAALREFNRRAAIHLPIFRAQCERFIEAVKKAAR